ncbi:molybdenum ABC transporter, periplasmic molybdate-binding protein [hydrothermal vent metagenome]|uniref:Molybdenum ABC transporter, periplasmic molybdate-binding protein n=1 Tax=hydrothermal vent metagenome TaxID=652676 RepID=A0A3B1D8S1_9ZZZZ
MIASYQQKKQSVSLSNNRFGKGSRTTVIALMLLFAVAVLGGWWLLQPPSEMKKFIIYPVDKNDSRKTLTLYCAAGMKPVMDEIIKSYFKEQNVAVECQYEGSGTLLNKLEAAKRGDLYLAADSSYIQIAQKKGILKESIPLAHIWPVIAVRKGNPKQIKGIKDLLRKDVTFALANPKAASVGKLTKKILMQSGDWKGISQAVKAYKPTVTETAADVKLGTVDAAILWNTTVVVHKKYMDAVQVPFFKKAVQNVTVGVLSFSEKPTEALGFARYLQAPGKGQKEFSKMGYETVVGDEWTEHPRLIVFSGGVNRLAIEQTLKQFELREGVSLDTTFNGCGILVATIKGSPANPPDIYFACDTSFMTQVQGRFKPSLDIAETDMVLIVPKGNPKEINSIHDLIVSGLRVGFADPKRSALGALTKRLLEKISSGGKKLYEAAKPNIEVQSATADILVNQLLAGGLDAAIVYRANVSAIQSKLETITIKQGNPTATQPIAVHKESKYPYLSQRLVDALLSNQSQERFLIHGFKWRASQ